jgi:zinc transporter 5/7
MEKCDSFKFYTPSETEHQNSWNAGFGIGASDRRLAFSRQASFDQSREPHTPISINLNDPAKPLLSRSVSSIDIPPGFFYSLDEKDTFSGEGNGSADKFSVLLFVSSVFRILRSGNRYMKRLFVMISLNVAYSTAELTIGLFTGRVGKHSDLSLPLFSNSCMLTLLACKLYI